MINTILNLTTTILNKVKAKFAKPLILEKPVFSQTKKKARRSRKNYWANNRGTQTNSSGGTVFLKAGKKAKINGENNV